MSYATRQAKRGNQVEEGVSPVKVALFIVAVLAWVTNASERAFFYWVLIGIGLGVSVGIGWGVSRYVVARAMADDEDDEDEDDD